MTCATRLAAIALLLSIATLNSHAAQRAAAPFDIAGRSSSAPWVAADGQFVAVAWGASADGRSDVFVAVSHDGGQIFGAPVRVNRIEGEARVGGEFPPRVAVRSGGLDTSPVIVVLWPALGRTTAIKTARSDDAGRTFGEPQILQTPDADGDRGWPALALDQNGTTHAIWLDHRGLADGADDGPAHGTGTQPHDGVAMAQRSGLYIASTPASNAGERELTTGVCYCCKTALVATGDGTLHAAWRHVYPGNLRDIAFTSSRDGGRSFSSPVRVSKDGWAIDGCPDDGPAMALDGTDRVHMVWPTVLSGTEPQGALFYASSVDGQTFSRRVRVPTLGGPRPTHPQIAIDAAGRMAIAWDERVDGKRIAAMREVAQAESGDVTFGDVITISEDHARYPVLAPTDDGFLAIWTTGDSVSRVLSRLVQLP